MGTLSWMLLTALTTAERFDRKLFYPVGRIDTKVLRNQIFNLFRHLWFNKEHAALPFYGAVNVKVFGVTLSPGSHYLRHLLICRHNRVLTQPAQDSFDSLPDLNLIRLSLRHFHASKCRLQHSFRYFDLHLNSILPQRWHRWRETGARSKRVSERRRQSWPQKKQMMRRII